VDTKNLQDKIKEMMDISAETARVSETRDLIAQEPTLQCPPFCGGEGSVAPTVDKGLWSTETQSNHQLGRPGEAGLQIGVGASAAEMMEKQRNIAEIQDESEALKVAIAKIASNAPSAYQVRGALSFSCEWTETFRSNHSAQMRQALATLAGVHSEEIVLESVRPGIVVEFAVDVAVDSQEQADATARRLSAALLDQPGALAAQLTKLHFPETCVRGAAVAVKPAVDKKQKTASDLADKLQLIDRIEDFVRKSTQQQQADSGNAVVQVPTSIAADIESLRDVRNEMQGLRHLYNISHAGAIVGEASDALEKLENLITLLLDYLSPVASAQAAELRAALFDKTRKQLDGIFDLIKQARTTARCMRLDPSKPAAAGCDTTNMALANMPLRDTDVDDSFDPLLQRQLDNTIAVPTGLDNTNSNTNNNNPPVATVVDHTVHLSSDAAYWMPEDQNCTGPNCG